jgi:phosphonate transport system substrate-binding protein
VLASSRPIPQLPLAVRADLDPRLERKLLAALLELPDAAGGPAILERIGALRFDVAVDAEYAVVIRLLAEHDHVTP